ncbi:MAG: orotidine-5'-phosphate decarboxylase [Candidatus Susulua stagnicola]|nr:orotidine-5'-phosphate decarboxylase [Candidatus Susulua stagnicola]
MNNNWEKLIVALDSDKRSEIEKVVETLAPKGVKFKIGSITFTKFGPDFVKELVDRGIDVFLDLKLYDIPNTMARASSIITELGCWAFTVHLQAGREALEAVKIAVKDTANKLGKTGPLILGVSVLTSSKATQGEINQLVKQADCAGIEGVISSAHDVKDIKKDFPNLKVITPGIRNLLDQKGDQKRIATASLAFANGADYIVVGRPIIEKIDYLKAAEEILRG